MPVANVSTEAWPEERLANLVGETPLERNPHPHVSVPLVGHRVFPVCLASTTHDEEIASAWGKVVGCSERGGAGHRWIGESISSRAQQPRSLCSEREHRNQRVIKPSHVRVAMEPLPVLTVSVLDHRKSGELHPVSALDPSCGISECLVRHRLSPPPASAESSLLDRALVPEELRGFPSDFVSEGVENLFVADEPSSVHIDPAGLIKMQALDRWVRGDVYNWLHEAILVRPSCTNGYGSEMSETLNRLTHLVNAFDARIQAAPSDSWSNQSPCSEWTARDVVAHVIGSARGMTAGLQGQEPQPLAADDDIVTAWNSTKEGLLSAVAAADLSQNVPGPFGPMPAEQLIGRFMTTDILVHTWDLARAVGGDEQLDADSVAGAYSGLKSMDAMIRGRGVFGDKIETPAGADLQTEFLQFLGRQV
jgi:uncharacterized protein (TIGR03086 family)